jgi:hypothetical protein
MYKHTIKSNQVATNFVITCTQRPILGWKMQLVNMEGYGISSQNNTKFQNWVSSCKNEW